MSIDKIIQEDMLEEKKNEEQKKRIEEEKLKIEERRNDLAFVLKSPEGRRFLWNLIKDVCKIHRTTADVSNVYLTYYDEGKRAVGTKLQERILDIKPLYLVQMVNEEISAKNSKKK